MRDHLRFLGRFLRTPQATGAIAPSSRHLAASMVEGIRLTEAEVVVELGAGTGVFTGAIQGALAPGALLVAVELDGHFADLLGARFPGVAVAQGSAEHLAAHLRAHGKDHADVVISGLPWAAFGPGLQARLMDALLAVLPPGGRFATFTYVHSPWLKGGRRFAHVLRERFARVEVSPVVWRNVPPAYVYRCTR